jgi:DNA-binding NtrC family response regulator
MLDTKPFNKQQNILILDDSAAYLELLEHQLLKIDSYSINVLKSSNVEQAISTIKNEKVDICISDYYLRSESALNLIDEMVKKEISLPLIVIRRQSKYSFP